VIFDVGHEEGALPGGLPCPHERDSCPIPFPPISHRQLNSGMKDMLNVMDNSSRWECSRRCDLRSTWNPARETGRDLGHLSVGARLISQ